MCCSSCSTGDYWSPAGVSSLVACSAALIGVTEGGVTGMTTLPSSWADGESAWTPNDVARLDGDGQSGSLESPCLEGSVLEMLIFFFRGLVPLRRGMLARIESVFSKGTHFRKLLGTCRRYLRELNYRERG